MTSPTSDPVSFFRDVAAAHRRCFWLDGGGAREWSGRRSIIGWLDEDDASRIEQLADLQAVRRALEDHVEQLSTDQRDALQLRVLEELPYSEVARRLQVTEATARARVSRALRQLASSVELSLIWKGATTHD